MPEPQERTGGEGGWGIRFGEVGGVYRCNFFPQIMPQNADTPSEGAYTRERTNYP